MSTQGQEASIPEQKDWVRKACRQHNVEIVRSFEDPAVPGSEIEHRPGLMSMLAFCERPPRNRPIEALVVWDADRLSRATSIRTAVVIDRLMGAGVTRLLTQEGWIDFDDDADRLIFNLKQDTGRSAYSKSLSKSVTRSAIRRAKEGKWVSGRSPYGYVPGEDQHLTPDEAKAEIVRWIFRQFVTTADSLGDIARQLIKMKAPPPPPRKRKDGTVWGGKWNRYAVRSILLNRAYLGEVIYNMKRRGKYHMIHDGEVKPVKGRVRTKAPQPTQAADRIVVTEAHPALTDPATFEACAKKLEATRWKRTTPIAGGGEWILSGLLHCGDCDGRMVGHTDRMKRGEQTYTYRHYVCHTNVREGPGACRRNSVTQEIMLREAAAAIRESFTDPKRLAALERQLKARARKASGESAQHRQRIVNRIAELDRLIDQGTERLLLVPNDMIDKATAKVRDWQAERQGLSSELARLEAVAENAGQFTAEVRAALEQLQQLEEFIHAAPPDQVRNALMRLVRKITVHFEHGKRLAGKHDRRRTTVEHLDIELTPEFSYLLGTGNAIRSLIGRLRNWRQKVGSGLFWSAAIHRRFGFEQTQSGDSPRKRSKSQK
jgi:DNA invertase Pin-like site-specific DNA recombinase